MATRAELIETLISRFESKEFLPTIGSVREFLALYGIKAVQQRRTNLKTINTILSLLDNDELQRIVEQKAYGKPTELGPLSDAIRNYDN